MREKIIQEPVLVLFDLEEEYAINMAEYLKKRDELPWKIKAYTSLEDLMREEKKEKLTLLVVAESSFESCVKTLDTDKIIVLSETGFLRDEEIEIIDKYQSADAVLHLLLNLYIEIAGEQPGRITADSKVKLIGVYSPIRRCLQSSFAVTVSEILAAKGKTLYLCFESFCGTEELLPNDKETDLADLIYFLNADAEKFKLHFQTMVRQKEGFYYIPPMRYGQNIISITSAEWMNLLTRISEMEMFDYVVMDLTDSIQGLFDILRICTRIFSITRNEKFAQIKMMNYENMLLEYEYKDIIEKTEKLVFPKFHYLPEALDLYMRSELADYARDKVTNL